MKRNYIVVFAFFLLCLPWWLPAQAPPSSLSIRILPTGEIPIGSSGEIYTYGGSAVVSLGYQPPLGLPLYASADIGYTMIDLSTAGTSFLNVFSIGTGLGVDLRFLRRLALNAWGKAGVYYAAARTESGDLVGGMNPYLWAGGDLSYYLTPGLSFFIGGDYRIYMGKPEPLLNSAGAFLGVGYRIPLGGGEDMFAPPRPSRLTILDVETDTIFPVFYRYYDVNPIGSISVKNDERGAAENVKVSVFIKRYMDSPKVVSVPEAIGRNEEASIDLYALFTDAVLGITEGDTVAAEIELSYDIKGVRKSVDRIDSVTLHHRNASMWDDNQRAAAFVTANDPAVLRLSKHVAALVRDQGNIVIDENLRTAMALHHALSLVGISYVVDPNSAYEDFVKNKNAVDFLQFPRQTLDFKAGDCDDLSILYCALLEAVSVDTAFITAPEHIYIAFALDMDPETARKTFSDPGQLIFHDEKVWIPLEVTEIEGGFLKAWELGAREWREHSPAGAAFIYPVADAWQVFKPVGLSGEPEKTEPPPERQISLLYGRELARFIDREIAERVEELEAQIAKDGDKSRLYNRLGVLYARYGRLEQAEQAFSRAIRGGEYAPSLINLGNILYLREEFGGALDYYKRAQAIMKENPSILLSLSRTYYAMEQYEQASESFSLMAELAPGLAEENDYLKQSGDAGTRAAEAGKQEVPQWEE